VNSSDPTLQPIWAASSDARELWSIVALLAVIGIGLVMLAVAVYRVTRPDRELLAPLEVMGRRKWRNSDPVWQRRELDAVRPPDAEPLSPAPLTPVPVEGFEAGPQAPGFDDLHGDGELGPDELFDVGVDAGLVGLPGGEVFDSDPTPPSTEVPVLVAAPARGDLSLAQLGMNWNPPSIDAPSADVADREHADETAVRATVEGAGAPEPGAAASADASGDVPPADEPGDRADDASVVGESAEGVGDDEIADSSGIGESATGADETVDGSTAGESGNGAGDDDAADTAGDPELASAPPGDSPDDDETDPVVGDGATDTVR
jgi:hypothetical protein